ncbi:MAG: TA system VapC family ribonuclease toxin [Actinomycetes bacterium]
MIDLLDVNVLVSLAWPNHVHHVAARTWFSNRLPEQGWATTPITECGFVRVSSNRSAIPTAVTPVEALSLLARIRATAGHRFLPDDVEDVLGQGYLASNRLVGHRLVTDAHLLALARRHGARLATLDRGVVTMAGAESTDVELIGV